MISQVIETNGFSTIRAGQIIADARELFAADGKTKPMEMKKLTKKKAARRKRKHLQRGREEKSKAG